MGALYKVVRQGVVRSLEIFLVVAFAVLTLTVLWGVFSRYVMGSQSGWTEELSIYLLIWVSLLGAALTYEERGHLGVDYIVEKLDPAARKLVLFFVELVVLVFAVGALVIGGWILVSRTLEAGQMAPTLQVKVGYLYAAAPLSGLFFTLFALEHIYELAMGTRRDTTRDLYNPNV